MRPASLFLAFTLLACGTVKSDDDDTGHPHDAGLDAAPSPDAAADAAAANDAGSDADTDAGDDDSPSPDEPQHWAIFPSDTSLPGLGPIGAGGDWAPDREHQVYRPAVGAEPGGLVVFLPGCGGAPDGYTDFLETAQGQGYHVIGLDYPNICGLNDVCGTDPACSGAYRREVTTATDTSDLVPLETHFQDAINKRLKAVLRYLEELDPRGAWEQFVVEDAQAEEGLRPNFPAMVFAGHSLGGGHAAFFGKRFDLARVIMISNPADAIDACSEDPAPDCVDLDTVSADWLAEHMTPSASYYGLAHEQDLLANRFHRIQANWTSLQVPLGQQTVDDAPCDVDCDPHNSPARNLERYGDIWIEMLGTP